MADDHCSEISPSSPQGIGHCLQRHLSAWISNAAQVTEKQSPFSFLEFWEYESNDGMRICRRNIIYETRCSLTALWKRKKELKCGNFFNVSGQISCFVCLSVEVKKLLSPFNSSYSPFNSWLNKTRANSLLPSQVNLWKRLSCQSPIAGESGSDCLSSKYKWEKQFRAIENSHIIADRGSQHTYDLYVKKRRKYQKEFDLRISHSYRVTVNLSNQTASH